MKTKSLKIVKISIFVLLGLVALTLVFTVWFYSSGNSNLKNSVARVIPFPVVLVGGRSISMTTYLNRLDSLKANNSGNGSFDERIAGQQILDQLISEKKTEIIAESRGVSVPSKQLNEQFTSIQKDPQKINSDFSQQLNSYGLSQDQFEQQVLEPELLYTNLIIWFNGQRSLNPQEYGLADQIIAQTDSTSTFASEAEEYSQDEASKQLGGDIGNVDLSTVLPEFREPFESFQPGDLKIVPSRYGLHIFQVEDKTPGNTQQGPSVHVREIFLKESNFTDWFNQEIKNIQVKKILNF